MTAVKYDELAVSYGRYRRSNQQIVEELITKARLSATSSVLEVGAGTGNYSLALRARVGCDCTALEPSEGMRRLDGGC